MLNTIKHWLRVLITPSCWLRNKLSSKAWDRQLNETLDAPVFKDGPTRHTVFLNGLEIWICNYPYDYGESWRGSDGGLPTRRTVFRLHDALEARSGAGVKQIDSKPIAKEEEWPEYITGSWR